MPLVVEWLPMSFKEVLSEYSRLLQIEITQDNSKVCHVIIYNFKTKNKMQTSHQLECTGQDLVTLNQTLALIKLHMVTKTFGVI